jgi:diphthine-ammonia ligase
LSFLAINLSLFDKQFSIKIGLSRPRTMKVVALISGGKDSCFNMMQCIAAGHEIVALANITPHSKTELDSYMYQCVGHEAIEYIAAAMDLPLYREETLGISTQQGKIYNPTNNDEVEDLFKVLTQVMEDLEVEAVSVGAILSDYQRVRVENM